MLIEQLSTVKNALSGETVIVTGAGGGIGLEAAKAFCYLGARVIIPEMDHNKGIQAEQEINEVFGPDACEYYDIDLGDEHVVARFVEYVGEKYGCPDVLFNNAASVILGSVEQLTSEEWDRSYRINLKAPILLTKGFLPGMRERDSGVICFVPSSGAAPFMGAYEVFKTAQVELCTTLCSELENTNISAYSIGPGLVKTETAEKAIEKVALLMGTSKESIYAGNERNMLTSEESGTAFALSVLNARKYNGLEIGSIQVLNDFNMLESRENDRRIVVLADAAVKVLERIINVYKQQYRGWQERNIFERQWLMRDFKKKVGYSAEQMNSKLDNMAANGSTIESDSAKDILEKLKGYYENQHTLLQGWEKNPQKLEENSRAISGWIRDIDEFVSGITNGN